MKRLRFGDTSMPPILALAYFGFGAGLLLLPLGSSITFVPGAEQDWFALSSALLLSGLFIPHWHCRIASVVLAALCLSAVINSHRLGVEYQHQMCEPQR